MDFVLKGTIKVSLLKADAKDFSFTPLSVNVKEVSIEKIKRNIKAPAGWSVKNIGIYERTYAEVTGTKITIKKGGTFTIGITLQKTGYYDYDLQGQINIDPNLFLFIFELYNGTIHGVIAKGATYIQGVTDVNHVRDKTVKTINIPNKIGGVAVKGIGYEAFKDCSKLTSVTIPDGVTEIDMFAFKDCSSLTSVNIPDSVIEIDTEAFKNCSSLTSITIPDGVTLIRDGVFEGCSSLTSVTIPDGVTKIFKRAFYECSSLTSVNLDEDSRVLTEIEKEAFESCYVLRSITIPNSVHSIGNEAFLRCRKLVITFKGNPPMNGLGDDVFGTQTGYGSVKKIRMLWRQVDGYKKMARWVFYASIIEGY